MDRVESTPNGADTPRRHRPRRLDPHRGRIASLLTSEPDITANQLAALLRPDIGPISTSTVRKYLAEVKDELANPPPPVEVPVVRTAPDTAPLPQPDENGEFDLSSPDCYLNRELTWLSFNTRVLREAEDPRVPLMERIKFLAIANSNLDEFFMKRIGGLKQQAGAGLHEPTVDGRTPDQQIAECVEVVRSAEARMRDVLLGLVAELKEHDIHLLAYEQLSTEEKEYLRGHYLENIYPLVTPQATDPAHPFPFISNLSLNILVVLRYAGDDNASLARVKVPVGAGIPRLLKLPDRHAYVRMESVMAHNLDLLFPGMEIDAHAAFRVTRNANTDTDEDRADDLLALIESELRDRKFAPVVRLETTSEMPTYYRGLLAAELGLDENRDVFEKEGMLGMRDLMELISIPVSGLHDVPHHPVDHPELVTDRNIFHAIRDSGPFMVHLPFQSYATSVERFLERASRDPNVRAIKMTLYRTSARSKVIELLIDAARNGKQVAVVVELKARFDEEANIRWANRLEQAGVHVTYGVVGLKTHCKVILVVRQDYNGLRRYAHIGTGNYHAGTARLYSDLGLLTCDPDIGRDLTELLNYLTTGYKPKRNYSKLLVAPKLLKQGLLARIRREIEGHSEENPGLIRIKTNALEDADVARALYEASQAGVQVDLLVRDSCRVRPGIPGLSENIRVFGIVGRFLEHARIYYFRNGGENEQYYIGSADCMKRNLESRVEFLAPVEDPALREDLRAFIETQLHDERGAWQMQPDGSYERAEASDQPHSQQAMIDWAARRVKAATRLRKRKPRGITRRNVR
ncbi:MAG: polyphosphate kinase 1 [Planctomycetota bacterium]|jgi:polyphosphate kinase